MTRWTSVRLAKARANKAKASTARARAKAKGSKDTKDSTDRTRTRARTRTRIRLNVGTVESADTARKTVGARRVTNKGGSKGKAQNQEMQRTLSILTRRIQQMLNQKLKSVDSTWINSTLTVLKCRGLNGSRLESTQVQERDDMPQSVTYGKTIPGDSHLTFRTATGEIVKGGKRMHVVGCDDWGVNLRVRGEQAPVCEPLLSLGQHTTMGGVTVLYGDKGLHVSQRFECSEGKLMLGIQKEVRDSQYRGCTVAYKENNVYNIYIKPRGSNTDAMPLSDSSAGSWPGPNL